MQLTDVQVRQILSLKRIKLEPWQIARVTGITVGKVKKICASKIGRKTYKKKFKWEDYNNSII